MPFRCYFESFEPSDATINRVLFSLQDMLTLKLEKGLFHDYLNNSSVLNFKATSSENSHSRKRREVQTEVTMEENGVENEDDFHEFQLRHHHSRFRRDAAEQCGPLKCNSKYKYQTYGFWGLCLTDIFLHRL